MTTYCSDIDLLFYEPNILRDAAFASQTLLSGTGQLAGTTFTISGSSFTDSKTAAGQVIVLGDPFAGCYPIISIESGTSLTLSVLHDELFPVAGDPAPAPVGTAPDILFTIRTFWAQRVIVSELLSRSAGLDRSREGEVAPAILNPQVLRRACALGTLQMIYSALSAASIDPGPLSIRADIYERLYRRAIQNTLVDIDLDGDGKPDATRCLGVLVLHRG
ncbi:MAG: hypothetical protein ACREJC_05455 [Tepidisphaeraceae bacterium]